ncbi:MAG: polyhydroxyalkanoic acid system family protein [Deltaproteobacteria bacterium]|nr:polyhydroxyalkanoic acid system family protein [Deltaproteobacteria bacterium]
MEIQCSGSANEIYTKIKTKFLDYKAQGKLQAFGNIDWDDQSCTALAKGTGFTGKIKCQDNKIVVDLDLNFLLKAMKGQIEDGIRKTVAKALG